MIDDESSFPDPVRRIISVAAPYPNDAARPADKMSLRQNQSKNVNINLHSETIFLFVKMALWMISDSECFAKVEQVLAG